MIGPVRELQAKAIGWELVDVEYDDVTYWTTLVFEKDGEILRWPIKLQAALTIR